jgi:hypothetical protein
MDYMCGKGYALSPTRGNRTMLIILFCLAQALLPSLTSLLQELELQSGIFSVALFAFVIWRLRLEYRPRVLRSANG